MALTIGPGAPGSMPVASIDGGPHHCALIYLEDIVARGRGSSGEDVAATVVDPRLLARIAPPRFGTQDALHAAGIPRPPPPPSRKRGHGAAAATSVAATTAHQPAQLRSMEAGTTGFDAGGGASDGRDAIFLPPDQHVYLEPAHLRPVPPPGTPGVTEGERRMIIMRNSETRDLVHISGPEGSGKSTIIKMFATRYRSLFPRRPIVLVSALGHDSTLETEAPGTKPSAPRTPLAIFRVKLASFVGRPITEKEIAREFRNACVIIDDVEGLDEEEEAAVQRLANAICVRGRHYGTTLVYACHNATNYGKSRTLLNECQTFVFYPLSASNSQLQRLLGTYGGMDRKQISALRRLPSRWVALKKRYPPLIVYDGGVFLLNPSSAASTGDAPSSGAPAAGAKQQDEEEEVGRPRNKQLRGGAEQEAAEVTSAHLHPWGDASPWAAI